MTNVTSTYRAQCWSASDVAAIEDVSGQTIALISIADAFAILPGIDLWDTWPLQLATGETAKFGEGTLWFALSAPFSEDPGHRHGVARIRLLLKTGTGWVDCGPAMPDGFSPGSREWAGSAVFAPASREITLYFTAAGRRGETIASFEQRLFETTGTLSFEGGTAAISDWSTPRESFVSDDEIYVRVDQTEGVPGEIKAFRDPAYFRDPADGAGYLLFTASLKGSKSAFNGAVGIARRAASGWGLMPPLVHADGLNNELERAHVVVHAGLYYMFWSTQRRVFDPSGPSGPNGLYGMVAPTLFGPYTPLNGTGLIASNPPDEPLQAYSWWVQPSLDVISFIDHWGLQGRSFDAHPELLRQQFGGTPAPVFQILLDGDRATVALS